VGGSPSSPDLLPLLEMKLWWLVFVVACGARPLPPPSKVEPAKADEPISPAHPTTLTADLVLGKITSAYMPGVERCYRNYLKKDASARGKLVLELSVNAVGRATDAIATGVSDEVRDCATAQMAAWRFPIPRNKAGAPTTAAFRIVLALAPGS